jgi:hypothetical protein
MHQDSANWVAMFVIGIPALLIIFMLIASIVMIFIPSLRKAGLVLLGIFLVLPVILFFGFFWIRLGKPRTVTYNPPPQAIDAIPVRDQPSHLIPPQMLYDEFVQQPQAVAEKAPLPPKNAAEASENPEEDQTIDKKLTAETVRYIDGLSKVLAKAILENPKTLQDLASKLAEQNNTAEKDNPPVEKASKNKPAEAITLPPKPDWINQPFRKVNNDYIVDVIGDPFLTARDCESELPKFVMKQAVVPYLERTMPDAVGKLAVPAATLKNFVVDRWVETRNMQVGEMQIMHANVRLDAAAQDAIQDAYRRTVSLARVQSFGFYFAGGFLLLASVWGYLKADLAFGGSRRGSLRIAAGFVILSIVAALAFVA